MVRPAAWQVALVAVALVAGGAAIGGGAYAQGRYDAQNAKKVDGLMAVKASVPAAKRRGRLVATDRSGRVPDSARVGGATRAQLSTMSISPQGAALTSNATRGLGGVTLAASGPSGLGVNFVVPPNHLAATRLTMDVLVEEDSANSCAFDALTAGEFGPSAPGEAPNIDQATWDLVGVDRVNDMVPVPAGGAWLHTFTFRWSPTMAPGSFAQFVLQRNASLIDDTCGPVYIRGLQLHY